MLSISLRWGLTTLDFKERAKSAEHPREQERWLALAWVSEGKSKEEVAHLLQRHYNTILNWINRFNENGPEGLRYHPPTGGRSWLTSEQRNQLRAAMLKPPNVSNILGIQWTYKQVIQYCQQFFQLTIKRGTAGKYIKELGFVRKRPKQRYGKASVKKKENS